MKTLLHITIACLRKFIALPAVAGGTQTLDGQGHSPRASPLALFCLSVPRQWTLE